MTTNEPAQEPPNPQDPRPERPLKVIVADDQATVREPLAAVLGMTEDIDVVAAAADGTEVLAAVAATPVDVVLMDLRMPVMDGTEATRRLSEEHPGTAVVVLTTFADDGSILAALSAGARGYLTKNGGRQDIVRAIRAAAAGQSVLDHEVQNRLLATVRTRPSADARPLHYEQGLDVRTPMLDSLARPMHVTARENAQLGRTVVLLAAELAQPQTGTTATIRQHRRPSAQRFLTQVVRRGSPYGKMRALLEPLRPRDARSRCRGRVRSVPTAAKTSPDPRTVP
nr:hypothetical protein StreXyl84_65190 [Streptomyces sp. Xyl84]